MQTEPYDRGWAAGPRRRVGVAAAVAVIGAGLIGGVLGRLIAATVLPGATFAVVALSFGGLMLGALIVTSFTLVYDDDIAATALDEGDDLGTGS